MEYVATPDLISILSLLPISREQPRRRSISSAMIRATTVLGVPLRGLPVAMTEPGPFAVQVRRALDLAPAPRTRNSLRCPPLPLRPTGSNVIVVLCPHDDFDVPGSHYVRWCQC
uniref:Uncharacterized protein n=1 Tax=Arundo donax TaxID=35708 RepID=A0A0A9DG76_ARUDO